MLVSTSELATYMNMTFTDRQRDAAELVVTGLEGELEALLNRPVSVQEFTDTHVVPGSQLPVYSQSWFYDPSRDRTIGALGSVVLPPFDLHLRHSPVTEVHSLTATGGYVDDEPRVLEPGLDYTLRRWGLHLYTVAANDRIDITYSAGLDGAQVGAFRIAVLRAASREMQNMVDDVIGIADLQTRQVTIKPVGFTDEEKQMLRRYRRRQV